VDATHKVNLDLELETPSGQTFTGWIMKGGEWRQVADTVVYELSRDGEPYARATVKLAPPPPTTTSSEVRTAVEKLIEGQTNLELELAPAVYTLLGVMHHAEKEPCDRLDRERGAADTLWPDEKAPRPEPARLDALVLGTGRHRLLGLTPESLTLTATAGYFASDPIPLELESFDGRPIKIVMHTTPHCDKEGDPSEASCASCHKQGEKHAAPTGGG
jgi:hypothetical protein